MSGSASPLSRMLARGRRSTKVWHVRAPKPSASSTRMISCCHCAWRPSWAGWNAEPEADGVYSDYERRHADGRLIDRVHSRQVTAREALHLMATGRSPVSMQTLVLRKSCIVRLGGFSEDRRLNGLDDLEFFIRLFLAEPLLVHVPEIVQAWVLHDRNYSSGPQFQDAREHCLRRLSELSLCHPALQEELKRFQAHTHTRLGIYFLETGAPARAVPAFSAALQADPFSLNTYYLLLKSIVLRASTS